MIIYTLRRLLLLLVTLFFLSLISFSLLYFTPHGPLNGAKISDAYLFFMTSLFQGEFGDSSINGMPIQQQLLDVLPATLELCIVSFFVSMLIGIPLGITAGISRRKWPDIAISTFSLIGFSIPVFLLALLLILLFSLYLGWFPVSGRYDLLYQIPSVSGFALIDAWLSDSPYRDEMLISVIHHMILPVLTLSLLPMTEVIRLMRNTTTEVYAQNYIKAAAARGLSRLTIIHRHVLHNTLPYVISTLGSQFSFILTLAMISEIVFSWPGLGRWLIMAIRQQDYAAISAGVMVIGTLVVIINIISDIVGTITNPLKHKEQHAFR